MDEFETGMTNIIVVCREEGRNGEDTIIYKVNAKFEEADLNLLSLRSRYNPELQYFVMENYEDSTLIRFFTAMKDPKIVQILIDEKEIVRI